MIDDRIDLAPQMDHPRQKEARPKAVQEQCEKLRRLYGEVGQHRSTGKYGWSRPQHRMMDGSCQHVQYRVIQMAEIAEVCWQNLTPKSRQDNTFGFLMFFVSTQYMDLECI
jgi:hypothetical protein